MIAKELFSSDTCHANRISRREWLTFAGLTLASACGRKKGTGYPGYALIATSGDNSLAVVDLTAFRLLKLIPLGASPAEVINDSGTGHTYVLTPSSGSVHLIDGSLRQVLSRKLADELSHLQMLPNGHRLVATAADSQELIEADPVSLKIVRRHKLGAKPIGLEVSSRFCGAVTEGEQSTVELLDIESGKWSRTQMGGAIGEARFRADGAMLLASNFRDRSLTALDVPSLRVIADLPLAMRPENLCFNSDGGQLFVSGSGMDGVAIVFPYKILEVEQTVLAGRAPGTMACSSAPAYLFVGSREASGVCVLDVNTRKVIGIVDVAGLPGKIVITPDSQYALVLDENSGSVAVIHIPAIRGNRTKSGASLFTVIPVGDKPIDAAIITQA